MTRLELLLTWRTMRRHVLPLALVVLCMTVAIAWVGTSFELLSTAVLRPIATQDTDQLVFLSGLAFRPLSQDGQTFWGSAKSLRQLSTYALGEAGLLMDGATRKVRTATVAAPFFSVFEVTPRAGRFFVAGDEATGSARPIVISHRLFTSQRHADPLLVGSVVSLDGKPHVIVGVAPEGFDYPATTELWIIRQGAGSPTQVSRPRSLSATTSGPAVGWVARLTPGTTATQARAELLGLLASVQRQAPPGIRVGDVINVVPLREVIVRNVKPSVESGLLAALFVSLIAGVNCSTVLGSLTLVRRRDYAVCQALGTPPTHVALQLLLESLVIVTIVSCLSVPITIGLIQLVTLYAPVYGIHLAGRSEAFRASLVGCLLFAGMSIPVLTMSPLIQVRSVNLAQDVQHRSATLQYRRSIALRKAFLATEVALTFALLVGAVLCARTFVTLESAPLGFDTRALTVVRLAANVGGGNSSLDDVARTALEDARRVPGIIDAAVVNQLPIEASAGEWVSGNGIRLFCYRSDVIGDYFRTLGIAIRVGRALAADDSRSVVVSESVAKALWGTASPLGQGLRLDSDRQNRTVVGVVADVASRQPGVKVVPQIYTSASFGGVGRVAYLIARCESPCMRSEDKKLASDARLHFDAVIDDAVSMGSIVAGLSTPAQFRSTVAGVCALFATLFAVAGSYGLTAFTAVRRAAEVGIRMSLGATPLNVVWLFVSDAAGAAALGIAVGIFLASWLMHLLRTFVVGAEMIGLSSFVISAMTLLSVVIIAATIPAWKAARMAPSVLMNRV